MTGCGRGGPHPGRRSQPEPAASGWSGGGRAQSAPRHPHACPRSTWCQDQLPGCYSKCLLLVALWRGSGVPALKCIGLYMERAVSLCAGSVFSLEEISVPRAGLARVTLQGRPPCDSSVPSEDSPSLGAAPRPLGPGLGPGFPRGNPLPLTLSPPDTQTGMRQPCSFV